MNKYIKEKYFQEYKENGIEPKYYLKDMLFGEYKNISNQPTIIDKNLFNKIDKISEKYIKKLTKTGIRPHLLSIRYLINKEEKPKIYETSSLNYNFSTGIVLNNFYSNVIKLKKEEFKDMKSKGYILNIYKKILLENFKEEEVVIIDFQPLHSINYEEQRLLRFMYDIKTICITDLIIENNQLFYKRKNKKIKIKKVINNIDYYDLPENTKKKVIKIFKTKTKWQNHARVQYKLNEFNLNYKDKNFIEFKDLKEEDKCNFNFQKNILKSKLSNNKVVLEFEELEKINPKYYIKQEKEKRKKIVNTLNNKSMYSDFYFNYIYDFEQKKYILLNVMSKLSFSEDLKTIRKEEEGFSFVFKN